MKEVTENHVQPMLGVRETIECQSPYSSVVQHFSGNEKVDGLIRVWAVMKVIENHLEPVWAVREVIGDVRKVIECHLLPV